MERKLGDITNVPKTGLQIIIQGLSTQGVMGYGVASAIKNKWPMVWYKYKNWIRRDSPNVGEFQIVHVSNNVWVINALIQRQYRGDLPKHKRSSTVLIDYTALEKVLINLSTSIRKQFSMRKVTVNVPSIGCGLANGDWDTVEEIIVQSIPPEIDIVHWVL